MMSHQVVGMADAAAHLDDVVRSEATKNKETERNNDNEFNTRKNFLDKAVNALKEATYSQFNIVICTDQARDDFQDLQGQILPMNLLNLEISAGKFVDFQVYVFDTGKYLRHGKYERDHWWYWGNNKQFYDPAAMHVHFEVAQKKLDTTAIKAAQDQKTAEDKTAADAAAAANTTQATAAANEATTLKTEAAKKAADAQTAARNGQSDPSVAYGGGAPVGANYGSGAAGAGGYSDASAQAGVYADLSARGGNSSLPSNTKSSS